MSKYMSWIDGRHNDKKPECPEAYKEISNYIVLGATPTMSIKDFLIKCRELFEASKNKDYDLSYEIRTYLYKEGFTLKNLTMSEFPEDLKELEIKYGLKNK